MTETTAPLVSCHCCGLIQQLPIHTVTEKPICARCTTPLPLAHHSPVRHQWTQSLALTALIFYIPALTLPLLRIERLGHRHEDSLFTGLIALFEQGYWFIGLIILFFSVLLPPFKLLALLTLSSTNLIRQAHHRALTYRAVELLGRWGMLDVMLVAILVAFVKLGGLVSIQAGSGLIAFALLVLFSLFASVSFNPHALWSTADE
ncbi:putative paraquat-inducible protein A [Beggiatoa alba B18LD]|uniref:Putative paraquat-inducible protein A n=1 Tax=Beggiatoa alba B18LD TaxID=395493 RepID=I3CHA4_9GAMM|nr:paraquat-inducible protein A [Beggiatoa alba]EIJ42997.1 putative paraquat-inducible protein A [Beggiatoa alba B18LD]